MKYAVMDQSQINERTMKYQVRKDKVERKVMASWEIITIGHFKVL
jgi:hypothetical protein